MQEDRWAARIEELVKSCAVCLFVCSIPKALIGFALSSEKCISDSIHIERNLNRSVAVVSILIRNQTEFGLAFANVVI